MNRRTILIAVTLTLTVATGCGTANEDTGQSASLQEDSLVIDAGTIEDSSSPSLPDSSQSDDDTQSPAKDTAADSAEATTDVAADSAEAVDTLDAGPTGCDPPCTLTQMCKSGVCVDVPQPCGGPCALGTFCESSTNTCLPSACTLPTFFSDSVQKVSFMQIATTDQGCDLTGDGSSDNVFGKILKVYADANIELLKSVQNGVFILLLEGEDYDSTGKSFVVNGYLGELDPSNQTCPVTASFGNCKYTVDSDNFATGPGGSTCDPQMVVSPATVQQDKMTAGGSINQVMTLMLPVVGGLPVKISGTTIKGVIKGPTKWTETKKGKICGVITTEDFKKAIDAVPAESWKEINLNKDTVQTVLEVFLAPDIDLNADGKPDAISLALDFESVPASITQVIK